MIWHALQFDWPSFAFLLLLLIPILWIAIFLYQYRQQKLGEFASQAVQDVVVEPRDPVVYWMKVILFCLAWICGVFALMQPKGNERYVSTAQGQAVVTVKKTPETAVMRKNAHEVVFLVDVSASMKIADVNGRMRLDVAKEIVDDVIRHLKGENISLFAFTSATIQVVPSTLDYFFTRLMLQQIIINEGETEGTDFKQALEFLKKLYYTKPSVTGKTVVILSDGGDTHLAGLSGDPKNEEIANIVSPISDAEEKNLRVFTVGLGSSKGKEVPGVSYQGKPVISAMDEALLRRLSIVGRGSLYVLDEMNPFEISKAIYQKIARDETFVDASVDLPPPDMGDNTRVYDYYFQYPLGIAILALIGYLFIPDTRKRIDGSEVRLFFLIMLIFHMRCAAAWSLQPPESLELARAYFEAGDYSHARMVYEGLQDDRLALWKKEILDYNIATSLLADGKWDESALALEALADKNILLPLLKQRILSNLALSKVGQLKSRLSTLNENSKLTHEDYNLLYVLFREVLADIEKAESAGCALEKIEGAVSCPESLYLQEMRLEVKNSFNQFLKDYLVFRLTHLSLQEGVSALLIGEKSLLSQLEMFQETNFSEGLKKKYLDDYLNQGESWKPLWDQFAETLKSKSKEADFSSQRDAFGQSRKLFLDSLSLAEKEEFQDSTTKLENSYTALNGLLQEFISESSVREVLHQLLITYGLALVKDPLQNVSLEQILAIQIALEPVIGKNVDPSLLKQYEKARKYLRQSVESLGESHPIKARLFAEVSRFYVRDILEEIDFTPKTLATTVLENIIARQKFILLLNKLRNQVQDGEKGLKEIDRLMEELQASTLDAAGQFPEIVLARQVEAFNAKGNQASQCQCHPWDEVIPLFSEGYSRAQLAGIYLKMGDFKESSVQRLQKSAIESWEEALAKMRSKSSSKKESKQQEQKPESQPQDQDQSKDQNGQNAKLNDILRMVQEMENDDRSTPQQVKTLSGSAKGEERPW